MPTITSRGQRRRYTSPRIVAGVFDATTGEDLLPTLQPEYITIQKSLYSPFSRWSMALPANTDFSIVDRVLPMFSRLRFDLARYPMDEEFGPTCLHGICKGVMRTDNLETGKRGLSVYGTCMGGVLSDFRLLYNAYVIDFPELANYGGEVAAQLINYMALKSTIDGQFSPGDMLKKFLDRYIPIIPAGRGGKKAETQLIFKMNNASVVSADNRNGQAFGYDDEASFLRWSEWCKGVMADLTVIQNTSLDGPVWNSLLKWQFKPFMMLWTDCNPVTARQEVYYHAYPFRPDLLRSWDAVRQEGLSDWTTSTAIIDEKGAMNVSASRDDSEALNLIWVTNTLFNQPGDASENLMRSQTPVFLTGNEPASADRIGLRELTVDDWFLWERSNQVKALQVEAQWLGNWHKWNPVVWRGSVALKLSNRVRPGSTIVLRNWTPEPNRNDADKYPDFQAFVTGVNHTIRFNGQGAAAGATTTAEFTRGVPFDAVSNDCVGYYRPPVRREPKTIDDMARVVGYQSPLPQNEERRML
ncbi:MAG: hypothetical protein WC551_12725 [Patescibacteria group bacterium]